MMRDDHVYDDADDNYDKDDNNGNDDNDNKDNKLDNARCTHHQSFQPGRRFHHRKWGLFHHADYDDGYDNFYDDDDAYYDADNGEDNDMFMSIVVNIGMMIYW